MKEALAKFRAVKDPEFRGQMLKREQQKLERAKKLGKEKIIVLVGSINYYFLSKH